METKTEPKQRVLDFIEKFSDATAEVIAESINMNKLQVFKIVKGLAEAGSIKINAENNPPTYQVVKADKKSAKVSGKQTVKTETPKKAETDEVITKSEGRNTDKLKFNGELYGKGRLVLAVVKKYVEDNPRTTLAKLKEVFPDEKLQPRYGVIQELSKAKKLSVDRDRFFLKPEDLIKVGDKKVAVCNQFGANNLDTPLKHFKSLGYNIK